MRVAIVAGGPSSEAEVSRASARGVAEALKSAEHTAQVFELDAQLPAQLMGWTPDVVFPVAHGTLGEDGCLQGLLEVLNVPFVGSGVLASALAADKTATKVALLAAGLPVAASTVIRALPSESALPQELARLRQQLGPAFVVKPPGGGSAIGVSIIDADAGPDTLAAALRLVFDMEPQALLETFWQGAEVTCGVLDNDQGQPEALPPTLIRARAAGWYDFQSKYGAGGSEHLCPAPFEPELTRRIQRIAVEVHQTLGARDLSRTDFIVREDGQLVVLELNSLPGMTKTSLFPEAAAVAGIPFPALCDRLARAAFQRPRRPSIRPVPMPP